MEHNSTYDDDYCKYSHVHWVSKVPATGWIEIEYSTNFGPGAAIIQACERCRDFYKEQSA